MTVTACAAGCVEPGMKLSPGQRVELDTTVKLELDRDAVEPEVLKVWNTPPVQFGWMRMLLGPMSCIVALMLMNQKSRVSENVSPLGVPKLVPYWSRVVPLIFELFHAAANGSYAMTCQLTFVTAPKE